MENRGNPHFDLNLGTKILSDFIIELNIALRLVTSYPKNHPITTTSIQKVLRHLEELLEFREEITIGVARDMLIVGYAVMDPKNPDYGNLAKALFDHDIATVTFKRNTTADEHCCALANCCSANGRIYGKAAESNSWLRNPASVISW